jgi:hypothetical protein
MCKAQGLISGTERERGKKIILKIIKEKKCLKI